MRTAYETGWKIAKAFEIFTAPGPALGEGEQGAVGGDPVARHVPFQGLVLSPGDDLPQDREFLPGKLPGLTELAEAHLRWGGEPVGVFQPGAFGNHPFGSSHLLESRGKRRVEFV